MTDDPAKELQGNGAADLPVIWDSNLLRSTEFDAPLEYPYDEKDREFVNRFGGILREYRWCKPIPRSDLPDHLFISERFKKYSKSGLADFNNARNLIVVSERVKVLLESFEIGDTRFYEIPIVDRDGVTPLDGRWFILNVVSEKDCFVQDRTKRARAAGRPDVGYVASDSPNNDLYVRASAAQGADMWTDPMLKSALFFSDRLKRTIEAARFRKPPKFIRCAVVP